MTTELELASWRRVTSGLYAAEHVRACDPFGEDLGGLLVAARGEAG